MKPASRPQTPQTDEPSPNRPQVWHSGTVHRSVGCQMGKGGGSRRGGACVGARWVRQTEAPPSHTYPAVTFVHSQVSTKLERTAVSSAAAAGAPAAPTEPGSLAIGTRSSSLSVRYHTAASGRQGTQTDTDTDTNRQTDRQTDIYRHVRVHRHKDTDRQTDRH